MFKLIYNSVETSSMSTIFLFLFFWKSGILKMCVCVCVNVNVHTSVIANFLWVFSILIWEAELIAINNPSGWQRCSTDMDYSIHW